VETAITSSATDTIEITCEGQFSFFLDLKLSSLIHRAISIERKSQKIFRGKRYLQSREIVLRLNKAFLSRCVDHFDIPIFQINNKFPFFFSVTLRVGRSFFDFLLSLVLIHLMRFSVNAFGGSTKFCSVIER
jgi:hypothetical protein